MAIVDKRLCMGTFGDSEATLYTVPAATTTIVKAVTITNKTALDATVTLKFGGTEIVFQHTIMANDTITLPFIDQILEAAELIQGQAGTAAAVNYYISGKEITKMARIDTRRIDNHRLSGVEPAVTPWNFGKYTSGQVPFGWSDSWTSTNQVWAIREKESARGGQTLERTSTAAARRCLQWDKYGVMTDVEILARVRTSAATTQHNHAGIALRVSGSAGSENSYHVTFVGGSPRRLELARQVNNAWATIDIVSFAWIPHAWYYYRGEAVGTTIRFKCWAEGAAEPGSWTVSAVDANHASGHVGCFSIRENLVEDWDMFQVISYSTP